MRNPATAPWNVGISRNDVEKVLRGFKPTAMEDRWMCRADSPDARGDFVVHVHRSWTGDELLRMNVVLAVPNGDKASAHSNDRHATITNIIWDRGEGSFLATEVEAKDLAIDVCRGVLGCDLTHTYTRYTENEHSSAVHQLSLFATTYTETSLQSSIIKMRAATFIATYFLTASAAAQTIYCCTSNEIDQVVVEKDETKVCCQSSGGRIEQTTSTCDF
ncbi:uncharacterized protein J7T55_015134 [Diaporthe amygdali]|uniref:uncharacterized protein n=1 Tax=Phomopsis amygdali TaxID=1214568 RepID=UPI0022FF20A6|nr:uncharacterized protein J7T55_015134 [Diaporthe amygdali]KAJ0120407.1 uncharacterized protein J7T55_015134 [Diaporthe amygdali]